MSPSPATTDNHVYLSPISPILSAQNSLDPLGVPIHTMSDNSSLPPPPSPTLTAHSSGSILRANPTVSRDNYPHGTVSSIGSSSTERQDDSSLPHETSTHPFPILSHPDTTSNAGSSSSSVASFIKRLMHRVMRPSPFPSRETGTGLDTMRNDGLKGKGDNTDVKLNSHFLPGTSPPLLYFAFLPSPLIVPA